MTHPPSGWKTTCWHETNNKRRAIRKSNNEQIRVKEI
jgi:hypothetical protein